RHNCLLAQPPLAETLIGKIAAMNDLVCARQIAPIFIRKVEDVGKEIRHVLVRNSVTHKRPSAILTLRNGIVPVLHPSVAPKEHILVIRDITRCEHVGLAGLQIFVHDDAVPATASAVGEHFSRWLYSYG